MLTFGGLAAADSLPDNMLQIGNSVVFRQRMVAFHLLNINLPV